MNPHQKIQAATRYAFTCIGLMLLAFLVYVLASIVPLGLTAAQQLALIRLSLYAVAVLAVAGGAFSLRVAVLRKHLEK
ncbi:cytochrome b6 [Bergeriella denitrificans]|uniref:Uncharacterized protein n=1 Tax=Bergeriella denitrificans TaxID=494 RepID=A0A378UGA8_BERDE|nr:cytochrome b6 [Bergeriella denitrificans]STZ75793.1 Uncharacterised protein [Bergeriella denitrificans]